MDKIPKMMIEGAGLSILSKKTAKEQLSANQTLIIIFQDQFIEHKTIGVHIERYMQILNLHFKLHVIIDPIKLKGQQKFNILF